MIDDLHNALSFLRDVIQHVRTQNVNTEDDKQTAIQTGTLYFKTCRPFVLVLGKPSEFIEKYDSLWQALIKLAHGNNSKRTYQKLVTQLYRMTTDISVYSKTLPDQPAVVTFTSDEEKLIATLDKMIPSAADSYKQSLIDLQAKNPRLSFRGIAAELREVLREILDYLAPDTEVMSDPHYRNEPVQTKPTMGQKVRHILRSRHRSKSQRATTEKSIELIEQLSGEIARGVYTRASQATHLETTKSEVGKIKRYLDTVLFDLFEIK
jgi:hypothetical protein